MHPADCPCNFCREMRASIRASIAKALTPTRDPLPITARHFDVGAA